MATGMKLRLFWIGAVVLLLIVAAYLDVALRSSNELLRKIKLVQPGMNLEQVKGQLGHQIYGLSRVDEITHYGPIKDEAFCERKKLFIFAGGELSSTALDVYTDEKETIVYVDWHPL